MIRVDIWVGIAAMGGVESVINRTVRYLKTKDVQVRVVQLVWADREWLEEEVEFYYLIQGPLTSWDGVFEKYVGFYHEHACPDIVLVEGWPILNIFAKKLVVEAGLPFRILERVHDSIDWYAGAGIGGMEYLQYADAHMVLNREIEKRIREGIPGAQVFRINNPINDDAISYNDDRDMHKLAFVGRVSEEKDIPLLLRAVSASSGDWSLSIVGEGPAMGEITSEIDRLTISDRVSMCSWQRDPWTLLKDRGFLLVASQREIGPLVAVEALAGGMAVISRPVGIMTDVIKEGKNGYLFETEMELVRILDGLETGEISRPDPEACRDSVSGFLGGRQLDELLEILEAMVR
ncbi:MAG: glycosyltransferase [Eubacterium sp.]|nr:glycosyltransferase [Eubacterium sp.]